MICMDCGDAFQEGRKKVVCLVCSQFTCSNCQRTGKNGAVCEACFHKDWGE